MHVHVHIHIRVHMHIYIYMHIQIEGSRKGYDLLRASLKEVCMGVCVYFCLCVKNYVGVCIYESMLRVFIDATCIHIFTGKGCNLPLSRYACVYVRLHTFMYSYIHTVRNERVRHVCLHNICK